MHVEADEGLEEHESIRQGTNSMGNMVLWVST